MKEFEDIQHPSYGIMSISKMTCNKGLDLVGSAVKHKGPLVVRIRKASLNRRYGKEYFHEKERLIEVMISPAQFAEMITSMNTEGVPVTLKSFNGEVMPDPPPTEINDLIDENLENIMTTTSDKMQDLFEYVEAIGNSKDSIKVSQKKGTITEIVNCPTTF